MITSALMLVKRSETAIAVQLCRFLCRFTQLFIYQRKKNTYQYIKVVMISGQMYSPRDLYFAGKIGLSIYGIGNGKGSVYINRNFQICHTDEIGMLWFLLALLWAQCIVRVFVKYSEKKCLIIVGIVTVLGIYSSHLIWLPLSVQNGMAATVWVYIGFLIKDKEMLVKWKRYRSKDTLLFLCVIFWGISIVFGCTELYKNYYKLGIIDIVGAFSGCVVLYYCVEKIKNRNSFFRLQEFLTWIGKNSIYVYIIHYWEQKISPNNTVGLLVRRYLGINIYIDFAFSVVIILCICVLVIKIYEQVLIDYLKKKRS